MIPHRRRKKQLKKAQFTKPLTVTLKPEVFAQVKAVTDDKEKSMAEWVRDLIHEALRKIEEKEDVMR
jgi:predicted HicB family RNase H-like nuclease